MFNKQWKHCLTELSSNPNAAQAHLYEILCENFEARPPRHLDWWVDRGCGENCGEFIHRLYVHLCEDDFKRLRKGPVAAPPPPEAWLRRVANNRVIDDLKPYRPVLVELSDWEVFEKIADVDVVRTVIGREAVRVVFDCIHQLRDKDRILVKGHAEERSSAELVTLLGWKNTRRNRKRVADAADYAISNLLKLIKVKNKEVFYQLSGGRMKQADSTARRPTLGRWAAGEQQ